MHKPWPTSKPRRANPAKFEVYEAKDGWRVRLRAANGRIIATGEAYTRERDAWRAVDTIRKTAAIAK